MRVLRVIPVVCVLLAGCGLSTPVKKPAPPPDNTPDPLPLQQARAYGETVTGLFVSLVDFEDAADGPKGHSQVGQFSIAPSDKRGRRKFVVNITRTGIGAMEVTLGPGAKLNFASPEIHDFTGYTLLTMALYSEALRDDLQVTLVSRSGSWTSHRTLVTPGWNNVLIDIQRLARVKGFSITSVREVHITFADAVGDVTFNLDDIMLIDNRRTIEPTPPGIKLLKRGLDYELTVPGRKKPIALNQSTDGLWRLMHRQGIVRLSADDKPLAGGTEDLAVMGNRKVGRVEIVEHNKLRLRMVNTWYFPTRAGEWASLAIRQIKWAYTIYADGTWITNVELNNAGGKEIRKVGLFIGEPVAWDDGAVGSERIEANFTGPVARWNYMFASPHANQRAAFDQYLQPGRIDIQMGRGDLHAPGDTNANRFDESRGCYYLSANRAGHCRFTFHPGRIGRRNAVFHVTGPWGKTVSVNAAGMVLRQITRPGDGSVLFVLPGRVTTPKRIEVTGKPKPPRGG
ncbi:MAG: hypothetical protein QGH60_03950 [Phycisphaerae bacterium]|jgi:hypothetical protein|nr:hypothetical protein [Phycisphaerae bacterium]